LAVASIIELAVADETRLVAAHVSLTIADGLEDLFAKAQEVSVHVGDGAGIG
jgi:hypothetical protein